jgi:hypothetical protein
VASWMTAGRPLVNACRQGPAAKVSWLSSRIWASGSEALAQRSRPSASASMIPAASTANSCLAATTACSRVAARSRSGSSSVRVAMLLASMAGSIGMGVPCFRSPNWRTRSTGQANAPWGADQAQQPHGVVVWASADPRRRQQQEPALSPYASGAAWTGSPSRGMTPRSPSDGRITLGGTSASSSVEPRPQGRAPPVRSPCLLSRASRRRLPLLAYLGRGRRGLGSVPPCSGACSGSGPGLLPLTPRDLAGGLLELVYPLPSR